MTFLSDDWLASTVALADGEVVAGAFTGAVDVEVGGGPDGKVLATWTFQEGRLVAAGSGSTADADVSVTLTHDDARAVVAGDRDLNALFISGRMKTAGDTGPLLELIAATKSEGFLACRARLDAATTEGD